MGTKFLNNYNGMLLFSVANFQINLSVGDYAKLHDENGKKTWVVEKKMYDQDGFMCYYVNSK